MTHQSAEVREAVEALDDERRRDVVREVRDELRRVLRELELKRVAEDDVDVRRDVAKRRLEVAVDLDRVDVADALGEIAREDSFARADLEHDVFWRELGEALDDAEDVRVGEEVLAEPLLAYAHSEKHAVAFASICRSRSAGSSPRACARAASVWTTYAGSFGWPRFGCGARYGESVSARIRSAGTCVAARRRSTAFGKLALPANETYQPRSSAVESRCGDEKQWRTTVPVCPASAARVSASAARVWMTTGFPSSAASSSCARRAVAGRRAARSRGTSRGPSPRLRLPSDGRATRGARRRPLRRVVRLVRMEAKDREDAVVRLGEREGCAGSPRRRCRR